MTGSKGSEMYVVSDTHFGHKNMIVWSLRPDDFEQKFWDGFCSIPDDGVLIHCGDVSLGSDAITHMKLQTFKFKKWLIRGNHDHHSISWYLRNGWDMVADEMVINAFGKKILFTHIPLPKREGVTRNIHGHLHASKSHPRPDFYDPLYHFEVCPEVIGYMPARLGDRVL